MRFDDDERAAIAARLRERARQLGAEIPDKMRDATHERDATEGLGDSGDRAVADAETTIDLAEANRDVDELRLIGRALERLESGEYGRCLDCAADIPRERLQAQPLALRCLRCQTTAERDSGVRHSTM